MTIVIVTLATLGLFAPSIYGQNQSERQQQQTEEKPLPVLLVHGYAEDAAYMEEMGGYAQKRWYPILYSNLQRL